MAEGAPPARRALRLAHRGDWRVAPENSVEAMLAALRIPGCDGLELDVRCSADGAAVVLHDATLERVQRLPVACVTLTAAELERHHVPTLERVLLAVGQDVFVDVELKEQVPSAIEALDVTRGLDAGAGQPGLRSAVLSSFDPEILAWLAAERPSWPRWLNAIDLEPATIARARQLGCTAISVEHHAVDRAAIARVHAAGLEVAVWTVRELADSRRLESLGVIAICAEGAALDG